MIKIKGVPVSTIADAAQEFTVSTRTLNGWIRSGKISRPPTILYGARTIQIFPKDYLARAKQQLAEYRANSARERAASEVNTHLAYRRSGGFRFIPPVPFPPLEPEKPKPGKARKASAP